MSDDCDAAIHLVTCVGVDTELAHLPHFVDHYLRLRVPPTNFHVILNTADEHSANLERARALLEQRGINAPDVWVAAYTSDGMWAKRREVQARTVPPDAWVISADVDEFHEYPMPLPAFLAECAAQGANCVQGVFIDRLTGNGELAEVEAERPIWETFPVQADVQCTIGQTGVHHNWYGTVKVMAQRGSLLPSRGGHHPEPGDVRVHYLFGRHLATFPGIGRSWFRFQIPLRVHHFKWTASMPEALRARLSTPGVSPAGSEYGQKLIDYFDEHAGVRMADIPIRREPRSGVASWRRRVALLQVLDATCRRADRSRKLVRRALGRLAP